MTINIEEVLERAFEQAFLKALEQTVQVKAEELFRKALSQGSPVAERLQEKMEQGFQRFLYAAAADPRFNADTIMAAIEKEHQFSWIDGLVYRYAVIPATKVALLEQKAPHLARKR